MRIRWCFRVLSVLIAFQLYLIVVAKNAHAQLNFDVLKSFSNHVENEKRKQVEASTEAEYYFSNQTFEKVLLDDCTFQPGVTWDINPGQLVVLEYKGKNLKALPGSCKAELPDGARVTLQSTLDAGRHCIVLTNADVVSSRKKRHNESLSRKEATYQYWVSLRSIHESESRQMMSDILSLDKERSSFKLNPLESLKVVNIASEIATDILGPGLRRIAIEFESAPTENVDIEAVACAQALAALMRSMTNQLSQSGIATSVIVVTELYNGNTTTLSELGKQGRELAKSGESVVAFIQRNQRTLNDRHGFRLPSVLTPAGLAITPYMIGKGYYVDVVATPFATIRDVDIRIADEKGRQLHQRTISGLITSAGKKIDFGNIKLSRNEIVILRLGNDDAVTLCVSDFLK